MGQTALNYMHGIQQSKGNCDQTVFFSLPFFSFFLLTQGNHTHKEKELALPYSLPNLLQLLTSFLSPLPLPNGTIFFFVYILYLSLFPFSFPFFIFGQAYDFGYPGSCYLLLSLQLQILDVTFPLNQLSWSDLLS